MNIPLPSVILKGLPTYVRLHHTSFVNMFCIGAGWWYAIEKETYWQLPIIFVAPGIYTGFHIMKTVKPTIQKAQLSKE